METHIEKVIEKSVQGGYENGAFRNELTGEIQYKMTTSQILLDPLFWSSLGKAMGWKGEIDIAYKRQYTTEEWTKIKGLPFWMYKWHRFIDHLAEGKGAESFFKTLLSAKE